MDATFDLPRPPPPLPPLPSTPFMGTVPLPQIEDFIYIDSCLSISSPLAIDFSASGIMLRDEFLDSRLAIIPPVPIRIVCHAIRSVLHFFDLCSQPITSVWDVLAGVHALLHERAPDHLLSENLGARGQFISRLEAIEDVQERLDEHQRGVKLLDLLGGAHIFAGLVQSAYDPYSWELCLRPP